jgi:HlyD family type I secretion membrane fusion protein
VFGTWAALAPLNAAVVGEGVVKVQGNRKSIQHLEGGTITKLSVKEGSRVRGGDVLVIFDDSQAKAQVAILEKQQMQLLAVEARLVAESQEANEVSFPASLIGPRDSGQSDILQEQVDEFTVRRLAMAGQREVLEKRVLQYKTQLFGNDAQRRMLDEKLQNLTAERETQERLVKKGLSTKSRLSELQRAESGARGDLDALQTSSDVLRQSIAEVEAQIAGLLADRNRDVARDLRDARTRLAEVSPRLAAAQTTLEHTEIRSPTDGTVVDLKFFSEGQVVRPSETLFDIVPDNSPLNVEARVRVEEISDIKPGMMAEVHFTSYKQKTLPIIHATVTAISADRLVDERTHLPYYAVTVDVDPRELAASSDVQLYPGMPASVMITTEERSALDYLLGPLAVSLDKSFRER